MKKLLFLLLVPLMLWNCGDDDPIPLPNTPIPIQEGAGFFIINEGNFNAGNASLDYYRFADDTLFSGLFEEQNGQLIGDRLQSVNLWNDELFLVVNNSQKVLVISKEDLRLEKTIQPFTSPRYLSPLPSGEAYLSDQISGYIHRVDMNTHQKLPDSIQVSGWTEEMVRVNEEVFVANRFSTLIYVIDTLSHQLSDSLTVDFDPASMTIDKNGKLWVLCAGDEFSQTPGAIIRIDPASRQIEERFELPDYKSGLTPKIRMNPERDVLYFLREDIFKMGIGDGWLPPSPIIPSDSRTLYSLGIHPVTGEVYTSDAGDFAQRGTVYRYTEDGTEIQSFTAGVIPNGFLFY